MFFKKKKDLQRVKAHIDIDFIFLVIILILLLFSCLMVTSASLVDAQEQYGNPYHYVIRQIIFTVMGLSAMFLSFFIPTDNYQKLGKYWLLIAFILLIAVLTPGIGKVVNGSRRWIPLIIFNVQVSEIVKLCSIMYFSIYMVRFGDIARNTLLGLIKPLMILGLIAVLLLMQPDFGATVVTFGCIFGIMFVAGVKKRWFILLISLGVSAAVFLVVTTPYRMARLAGFIDPWKDAFGSGYQLSQALISFGRGDWFGLGLGQSVQKILYLPEAHTDFILSIIAEELGIIGVMILLLFYAILLIRGLMIANKAYNLGREFESYISYGIIFWIMFQVFVNTGVNTGILPTKGLTLPLISYGGSSLISMCFALGIVLRVDFENKILENKIKPKYVYKKIKK